MFCDVISTNITIVYSNSYPYILLKMIQMANCILAFVWDVIEKAPSSLSYFLSTTMRHSFFPCDSVEASELVEISLRSIICSCWFFLQHNVCFIAFHKLDYVNSFSYLSLIIWCLVFFDYLNPHLMKLVTHMCYLVPPYYYATESKEFSKNRSAF